MAATVSLACHSAAAQSTEQQSKTTFEVRGQNPTVINGTGTVVYEAPPPAPPAPVNVEAPIVNVAAPTVQFTVPPERSHPLMTAALITGIATVIGGGLSLAAYVDAKAQSDDYQDAINNYDRYHYDNEAAWAELEDAQGDAQQARDRLTVALGASAVALAATAVLILLDVSQPQQKVGSTPRGLEVRF